MRDVILETEHLTKIFSSERGGFTAAHDVSFEIGKGEALGIVGESGSGKTTVARLVTGLLRPTEGKIRLLGQDLTEAGNREWREAYRHIQMIFQTPAESFNPRYTLGSGIGESLRNAGTGRKKTEEKSKGTPPKVRSDAGLCRKISSPGQRRGMPEGGRRKGPCH